MKNSVIIAPLKQQKIKSSNLLIIFRHVNIPHTTLNDICSGRTKLEKCSAETVYKLAKTLGVSVELLVESGLRAAQRERSYECGLPEYLQHDHAGTRGLSTQEIFMGDAVMIDFISSLIQVQSL